MAEPKPETWVIGDLNNIAAQVVKLSFPGRVKATIKDGVTELKVGSDIVGYIHWDVGTYLVESHVVADNAATSDTAAPSPAVPPAGGPPSRPGGPPSRPPG